MKTVIILFFLTMIMTELASQNLIPVQNSFTKIRVSGNPDSKNRFLQEGNPQILTRSGSERLDSVHHWKMDSDAEQWKPYLRIAVTRDEYDNIIQSLSFCPEDDTTWGETVWVNHNLNLSFYNNENQLIEEQYYYWYDSVWINESKNFHSYDAVGNVIESFSQYWFSQEWVNTYRITKSYNPDQTIDSLIQYGWNEDNWIASKWTGHTYNPNGLIEIEHTRSHVTGNIFDENRNYYTYNNQDQLLEVIVQNPVGPIGSGLWGDFARTIYSYDQSTVTSTYQLINLDVWVNSIQRIYQYQNENLTIELYQTWDKENETWDTRDSIYYYYSTETATNEMAEMGSLKLYPNPASDILHISSTEDPNELLMNGVQKLNVYTTSGERILTDDVDGNNNTIDISDYLPGIYFIVLENGSRRKVEKLIKQ